MKSVCLVFINDRSDTVCGSTWMLLVWSVLVHDMFFFEVFCLQVVQIVRYANMHVHVGTYSMEAKQQ